MQGTPVSKGLSVGLAYLYRPVDARVEKRSISPAEAAQEILRYEAAREAASKELSTFETRMAVSGNTNATIFAAQREILFDEEMDESVREQIRDGLACAEYAVSCIYEQFAAILETARDELIRARCADIRDVRRRLIAILCDRTDSGIGGQPEPMVLVADELFPSDTVKLDKRHVSAILTQKGNATSHAAILAKSLGIPAILGIPSLMETIRDGMRLAVDAQAGTVLIEPEAQALEAFCTKSAAYEARRKYELEFATRQTMTRDGTPVQLGLNIGSADELPGQTVSFDFVGLFRSEFLYMGADHLPSEEEQFLQYRRAVEAYPGVCITLRTLDIGGDKELPYFELPKEQNPFLGLRALRLCFAQQGLFRTQLRAALRASAYGCLQLLFPMVGSVEDIRQAKAVLADVRRELEAEQLPFDRSMKIGAMIEIPAAAIAADLIEREVDFVSIGTNDLCQYITAADRGNPSVAAYYRFCNPAMLRLIQYVVQTFDRAGKPVCVCGEAAGDKPGALLLFGLGIRKLSMSAACVPGVKRLLSLYSTQELTALAERSINLETAAEIETLLRDSIQKQERDA